MTVFLILALLSTAPLEVETHFASVIEREALFDALIDGGYTLRSGQKALVKDGAVPAQKRGPLLFMQGSDSKSQERIAELYADAANKASLLERVQNNASAISLADQGILLSASHILPEDTHSKSIGLRISEMRSSSAQQTEVHLIRGQLANALLQTGNAVSLPNPKYSSYTLCIVFDETEVKMGVGENIRCDRTGKRFARPKGKAPAAYLAFLRQNALKLLLDFSVQEKKAKPTLHTSSLKRAEKQRAGTVQKNRTHNSQTRRKPASQNPALYTQKKAPTPFSGNSIFRPDSSPLGRAPPSQAEENAQAVNTDTFKNLLSPKGIRLSARAGWLARLPKNDMAISLMAQTLNAGNLSLLVAADAIVWDETQFQGLEANLFAGLGYQVTEFYGFKLDAGLLLGGNFFHYGQFSSFGQSIPGVQLTAGVQLDLSTSLTDDVDFLLGLRIIGSTGRGVYSGLTPIHQRLGTGAFLTLGLAYDLNTKNWFSSINSFETIPSSKTKPPPRAIETP